MEDKKQKETVKIVSSGHTYEFVLLDALYGLGIYHEWLSHLGKNVDDISKAVREMLSESEDVDTVELFKRLISGDEPFIMLRELLIKVVSIQKLFELCGIFLAGAKIDDEVCDDLGMCPMFRKRPHEVYTALMMAVASNYPDYFPFVLEKLDTGESLSQK
jgi:hypothetical protein